MIVSSWQIGQRRGKVPARLPRIDVVFRLGQCDKENHGWREGPPLNVSLRKFRSAGRAFTLRQSQFERKSVPTKKEYCFALVMAIPSLTT